MSSSVSSLTSMASMPKGLPYNSRKQVPSPRVSDDASKERVAPELCHSLHCSFPASLWGWSAPGGGLCRALRATKAHSLGLLHTRQPRPQALGHLHPPPRLPQAATMMVTTVTRLSIAGAGAPGHHLPLGGSLATSDGEACVLWSCQGRTRL
jgi:hypothetical protein